MLLNISSMMRSSSIFQSASTGCLIVVRQIPSGSWIRINTTRAVICKWSCILAGERNYMIKFL